ncbi:MAG: 4Fe-4S binding protein [Desulfobacteraceae bacterium]|nr:4Fe-4S binding protein [Desulfobacteraceae bacterium]
MGFPATKSGAEIKILQHIFSPDEAELATCLTYQFEPVEIIFERAKHLVDSPAKLAEQLDRIQKKGGIESRIEADKRLYCTAPLVVGMYEYQVNRLTPDFLKASDQYFSDKSFGIAFLSTKLPQMRTIPIEKSIQAGTAVSTFDAAVSLLEKAEGPFVILECICRKKRSLNGKLCKITDRKETCLAVDNMASMAMNADIGREITRVEAVSILEQNQKDGLVLQPSNTQKAEIICSCCGCCCGMLSIHKALPKPVDFWASNFHAIINNDVCNGCGVCETRCQVGAVTVSQKFGYAVVDLNRCIGCGVCVPTCNTGAISLQKKPTETRPPETRDELYSIIMAHKKRRFGKMKLVGKLVADAVRTKQIHLLK